MSSKPRGGFRTVDGLQIRYADSEGPASQHLVLTSPWPESLHAFDRMWPRLSGIARLLAIDLPGFGHSERRAELLSPMAMSEFLIRVLDEWEITDPHMICPDVGTPAALFAAVRQPGRIQSLVVSGIAYPLAAGGVLKELLEAPDIGALRSHDPRATVEGLMANLGPAAPSRDVIANYLESNRDDRFAESARYMRSYPDQLPVLAKAALHLRRRVIVEGVADEGYLDDAGEQAREQRVARRPVQRPVEQHVQLGDLAVGVLGPGPH